MESSPPRKDDEEREAEDQEDSGEGEENEWGDFASYAQLDEEEDDGNDDDMGAVCAPESKDELAEREEYQSAHDNSEEIDDASGAAGYDESAAAERPRAGPSEELAARMVDMKMQRLERDYAATISSAGSQREQEERAERLREAEAEILAELERSAAAGAAAMHSAPVPTEDEDVFDPFEENQRRPEQSPYRPISPLRPGVLFVRA